MDFSYTDWGKGIADNHYLGVGNLRNVRIDDSGVLRIMNKTQFVTEIPGTILNIESSYSDIENNWYSVFGSVQDTLGGRISPLRLGSGGMYQSKSQTFFTSAFEQAWSGGVPFRDYFIPFPAVIGEDVGFVQDQNNDGVFDFQSSNFEILVTKGNTQTKFVQQFSPVAGEYPEMLDDTTYVYKASSGNVEVKETDGTVLATITGITGIQDIAKLSDTEFVIVRSTELLVYNKAGALLYTLAKNFDDKDQLRHVEAKNRGTNKIVVLTHTRYTDDMEDWVEFFEFEWNGTVLSAGNSPRVYPFTYNSNTFSGIVNKKPHIGVINGNEVVVIFSNIVLDNVVRVWKGSSLTNVYNSYEGSDIYTDSEYGIIEEIEGEDQFVMFGDKTSLFSWDSSDDTISLLDDTLVAPNNVQYARSSNNNFAIQTGSDFSIYTYTPGQILKTYAIVGQDDFIYYSNGNSVGVIQELPGQVFDPTDDTTYSVNPDALDLPAGTSITGIAEVGTFLAISTEGGKIYFWDRLSDSFEIPVNISDSVGAIGSKNNILYVSSQGAGNAYIANLSSYQKLRNFSSLTPYRFDTTVSDIAFFDDGAYMSAYVENDPEYSGIWIYKNGAWTILGTDSPVTSMGKGSRSELVYATEEGLYVQNIAGRALAQWDNDEAFAVTKMEIKGTVSAKSHNTTYSMYFDNSFQESEYVKIYFRTTTQGAWQHIQTVTSEQLVAETGLFAFKGQLSIPSSEQIQYKIVLNTTSALVFFRTK